MRIEQRLKGLGVELPSPAQPVASYAAVVEQKISSDHSLLYISGQLPWTGKGKNLIVGRLTDTVDLEQGVLAARLIGIHTLSLVKNHLGDLDNVLKVVRIECYVNCSPHFTEHPKIADGCSTLLSDVFGDDVGSHSRAAVGVNSLPLGAAVEISSIFSVRARN